jgi:hypothetical protein
MSRHAEPVPAGLIRKTAAPAATRPQPRTPSHPRRAAMMQPIQRRALAADSAAPVRAPAPATNPAGLPEPLNAWIERQSGLAMDDVRVHRNSAEPAKLGALAYAQGSDIHLGPGQERHLPHEAWHVVQQKQGRVIPTLQTKGILLNQDLALEREADSMAALSATAPSSGGAAPPHRSGRAPGSVAQAKLIYSSFAQEADLETLNEMGEDPRILVDSAEGAQMPELAKALGQTMVPYEEGTPPDLAGDKLNYMVVHVVELGMMNADKVAADFAKGKIVSPSVLKLIACKGAQNFGAGLAAGLAKQDKQVAVVAATGLVHATGKGITSYSAWGVKEAAKHEFSGEINKKTKDAYGRVKAQRHLLQVQIAELRESLQNVPENERQAASANAVEKVKALVAEFFDIAIEKLNEAQKKAGGEAFQTTAREGWITFTATTDEATKEIVANGVPATEEDAKLVLM